MPVKFTLCPSPRCLDSSRANQTLLKSDVGLRDFLVTLKYSNACQILAYVLNMRDYFVNQFRTNILIMLSAEPSRSRTTVEWLPTWQFYDLVRIFQVPKDARDLYDLLRSKSLVEVWESLEPYHCESTPWLKSNPDYDPAIHKDLTTCERH